MVAAQAQTTASAWFVYIVRCADRTLYTGVALDVRARVQVHNQGKGARYTRARTPVKLVYRESAPSRSAALKREYAIKQMRVENKRRLIRCYSAKQEKSMELTGLPLALSDR